ncbi:MAG: two-component sensor histidine kinase [Phycisphaerales bacterium]|nr:two-component sensor histidine kinase [Phycisphaerales bacterium]
MTFFHGLLIGLAAGGGLCLALAWWALRRQERRVRAAERGARTAQRLAEIGAMTGGLAHEIKNPLSTIGLNAQLLSEGIGELPVAEDAKGPLLRRMGALSREAERLRGILTDFLQYAGEPRLELQPTDLNAVIEELVDFFHPQAVRQGVRLRTDLAPGLPRARLDAPHVKQAVLNLMLNAVQAMHAQTGDKELILRTRREVDSSRRPVLALHVIDTGPGIPAEHRQRLFQPYFTTRSGGTGLGLPTAQRLIEAHGGTIDVRSEPGKGTEFVVMFPAP